MTPMLEDLLQRRPYNAVTDFVDANVARGRGDKVAFTDSERALTYAQLQANSFRFAAALKTLGLREENRVILAFHDTDRKSTRLNSSHLGISYAVFCLK